ncbi:ABC transporter ATP-binding protein [Brevirhabdus sp.]|uniref:ABC transporter ATP-binding protein n=1 Tax=Brevirhabdus sp. TaxID=2004514 RepID=UPI00405888E8
MMQPPAIRLEGRHDIDGTRLFGPLAIDLPAARWSCLLGPSGVGKSTVLRLILGLDTGGTFAGAITASDGAPLADRVSYMAQSDLLLPWLSVRENILLGARLRGQRPDAARAADLLGRIGLTDQAARKPSELSGGMRQRVALARTLMEDRPVVMLDEPFSALDAGKRADMQELAAELLVGRTVLMVTHDPAEASRLGHQILVMSRDEVIRWQTPDSPPIRPIGDTQTSACEAALLAHLRRAAA